MIDGRACRRIENHRMLRDVLLPFCADHSGALRLADVRRLGGCQRASDVTQEDRCSRIRPSCHQPGQRRSDAGGTAVWRVPQVVVIATRTSTGCGPPLTTAWRCSPIATTLPRLN